MSRIYIKSDNIYGDISNQKIIDNRIRKVLYTPKGWSVVEKTKTINIKGLTQIAAKALSAGTDVINYVSTDDDDIEILDARIFTSDDIIQKQLNIVAYIEPHRFILAKQAEDTGSAPDIVCLFDDNSDVKIEISGDLSIGDISKGNLIDSSYGTRYDVSVVKDSIGLRANYYNPDEGFNISTIPSSSKTIAKSLQSAITYTKKIQNGEPSYSDTLITVRSFSSLWGEYATINTGDSYYSQEIVDEQIKNRILYDEINPPIPVYNKSPYFNGRCGLLVFIPIPLLENYRESQLDDSYFCYGGVFEPQSVKITYFAAGESGEYKTQSLGEDIPEEEVYEFDKYELPSGTYQVNIVKKWSDGDIDNHYDDVEGVTSEEYAKFAARRVYNDYKNGKETASFKCSIQRYYDSSGNLAVSPYEDIEFEDGSTKTKMMFDVGDEVVPFIRQGFSEVPLSRYRNGEPKAFEIIGHSIEYDGAVFQKLELLEIPQ